MALSGTKKIEIKNISPNTFCVNPWYYLRITANGTASYCSRATDVWEQPSGSLHDFFNNSTLLMEARESMLDGKFPAGCNRCVPEEVTVNGAYRKSENLRAAIVDNEFFHESVQQSTVMSRLGSKNLNPHFVFVIFGNQCNMSCRHCFRTGSNKLAKIYDQHNYQDTISALPGTRDLPSDLDWTQDQARWEDFLSFVLNNRDLHQLVINGGEPMVTPKFYELIDQLIKHNRTDIKISFSTNCTVFDQTLINKLQKFDHCYIDISIEAIDPVNDYVRVGADYQSVCKNFFKFLEHQIPGRLIVGAHPTPMVYTVEKVHTFLDICVEYDLQSWITTIHPQRFLKLEILPPEVKARTSEFLRQRYANVTNTSIANGIKKVCIWLDQPEPDDIEDLRKTFVQHTKDHDRMLGTDFAKTFPHLVEFYKAYGL